MNVVPDDFMRSLICLRYVTRLEKKGSMGILCQAGRLSRHGEYQLPILKGDSFIQKREWHRWFVALLNLQARIIDGCTQQSWRSACFESAQIGYFHPCVPDNLLARETRACLHQSPLGGEFWRGPLQPRHQTCLRRTASFLVLVLVLVVLVLVVVEEEEEEEEENTQMNEAAKEGAGGDDHFARPHLFSRVEHDPLHSPTVRRKEEEVLHGGLSQLQVGRAFQRITHGQTVALTVALGSRTLPPPLGGG